MTSEKVNDLAILKLSDFISPETFRLIPTSAAAFKGGISEIPVSFNLHSDVYKKLNFNINKLQKLYGFSIIGEKLENLNGSPYYSQSYDGKLKCLELNDCGQLWILKFEFLNGECKLYCVKDEEVFHLLNNCRKPPMVD